jgi:hypothetical protein
MQNSLQSMAAQRLEHLKAQPMPGEVPLRTKWTAEQLEHFTKNPVDYVHHALAQGTWDKQDDILNAVRDHQQVSVRAGQKVSKSNSAATAAFWWFNTKTNGRVVLTAPAGHQVKNVLWREIRGIWRKVSQAIIDPNRTIEKYSQEYIDSPHAVLPCEQPPILPWTGINDDETGRQIIGLAVDTPVNLQGISGSDTLWIVDEASGYPKDIMEAIQGNMMGGGGLLLLGNPNHASGEFFDSFRSKRAYYFRIHISSEDTPNYKQRKTVIKGLAEYAYVERKRKEEGTDSVWFQVRILGNFPTQSSYSVVALGAVEDSHRRWGELLDEHGLEVEPGIEIERLREIFREVSGQGLDVGVDPARFGDDKTAIALRRGNVAIIGDRCSGLDSQAAAGTVIRLVKDAHKKGERVRIKVDTIGIGSGVFDALVRAQTDGELPHGTQIVSVNVSELPNDPEKYALLRDELWFTLRDWYRDGGTTPEDDKTDPEVLSAEYAIDGKGRYKVLPKDKIKEELGRSPDDAEALGLSVIMPVEVAETKAQKNTGQVSRWHGVSGRGF